MNRQRVLELLSDHLRKVEFSRHNLRLDSELGTRGGRSLTNHERQEAEKESEAQAEYSQALRFAIFAVREKHDETPVPQLRPLPATAAQEVIVAVDEGAGQSAEGISVPSGDAPVDAPSPLLGPLLVGRSSRSWYRGRIPGEVLDQTRGYGRMPTRRRTSAEQIGPDGNFGVFPIVGATLIVILMIVATAAKLFWLDKVAKDYLGGAKAALWGLSGVLMIYLTRRFYIKYKDSK